MPHSLDELLTHADSKFTLVTMVRRRAMDLTNGARPMVRPLNRKVVTIAMDEVATGNVKAFATDRPPSRGMVPATRRTIKVDELAA